MDLNAPIVRRPHTQAERSSATRQLVIDAALRVLHTQGYSGATIAAIRDAAGVSTGALNHQFPTKAMLMTAIVERYSAQQIDAFTRALRAARTPRAAMDALLETGEAVIRRPEMAAVMEIHLARRNDPDLDRLTKPYYDRFARRMRLWTYKVRRAAGIEGEADFDGFRTLNMAVYRGLGMELVGEADAPTVNAAMKLWRKAAMSLVFGDAAR